MLLNYDKVYDSRKKNKITIITSLLSIFQFVCLGLVDGKVHTRGNLLEGLINGSQKAKSRCARFHVEYDGQRAISWKSCRQGYEF